MSALRNTLRAAAALTLGALLAPRPADASIPSAISHPQLTQPAAPTLPAAPAYVLLYVAPDGSCRVEFCRNDPVNLTDPTGLVLIDTTKSEEDIGRQLAADLARKDGDIKGVMQRNPTVLAILPSSTRAGGSSCASA